MVSHSAGNGERPAAEALLPLVRSIARTMRHGLPAVVELDDLVNDGVVGLLECAKRFDPSRGVDFRTYAGYRIRGAILDGLRARDPLPRSIRRALKAMERASVDAATPARADVARPPVRQVVALDEAAAVRGAAGEPEEELLADELRQDLRRAVAALPVRDREILSLRFAGGLRLREVAAYYGISVTRVAEVQDRAIRRLRVALEVPQPAAFSPNGRPRRKRVPP